MTQKLHEYIERHSLGNVYGVELEVEHAPPINVAGWTYTTDGSLRNSGIEFIFDGPAPMQEAQFRISELCSGIRAKSEGRSGLYTHSVRTSVHIHACIHEYTTGMLVRLATVYSMLEGAAFNMWGADREGSPYCVPLCDSFKYWVNLSTASIWRAMYSCTHGRNTKYSAFSLCRLGDLGTVEFRMFSGTNDEKVILEYLGFVDSLVTSIEEDDTTPLTAIAAGIAEKHGLPFDAEEAAEVEARWLAAGEYGAMRRSIRPRVVSKRCKRAANRANLI